MPSELTFRAQLVIKEQRQIYDYWCRQAGWHVMPRSNDLNVNKIANLAQSLSLLKINPILQKSSFYSSGARAKDVYGHSLKNLTLEEMEWGDQQQYWDTVYGKVVADCRPRQGVIQTSSHKVLFWLRLPLSEDQETVTDILCHDIPYPVHKPTLEYIPGFSEDHAVAY